MIVMGSRRRVVAAAALLGVLAACGEGVLRTIEVTGEGKAPLHYDALLVRVGAQFRASTSARAAAGGTVLERAVRAALSRDGVTLTPVESHSPAHFAGAGYWAAFVNFDVRMNPSSDAAGLIRNTWAAARAAGGVPGGITRVELEATDTADETSAARKAALADARARATQLAGLAGLRLGEARTIDDVPLGAPSKASLGLSGRADEEELRFIAAFVRREQDRPRILSKLRVRFAAR